MAISSAVLPSAVARVLGIKTNYKDLRAGGVLFLPQRLMVVGQGSTAVTYSTVKAQHTSAGAVAEAYGYGSPLHLVARQLFPANGDGVGTIPVTFYPLADDPSGVAATGTITPVVAATYAAEYSVAVNNIKSTPFVIDTSDTVATVCGKIASAITAVLEMPVTAADGATVVNLTSKWKGTSANDITVAVNGPTDAGVSFGIAQPSGGLVNPDVQPALDQVGNIWETMGLNCLDAADTDAFDAFSVFAEGRWGALTRKPLVFFCGNTAATVTNATAVSDARKTDRGNGQLVAPGSADLPCVVAARQLARILVSADTNPARDYGSLRATGLTPGTDAQQWLYPDRDSAVKKGSSTIEVKDGVVNVSDVVTFYHPSGDAIPPYRYLCDIVKIQNILFNFELNFNTPEWDGAPLIPDGQPTINPDAKTPSAAVAQAGAITDSLALNAIISSPAVWKENTFAEIDAQNPKRLNLAATGPISGNTNILSADLNWGFQFGG